MNKLKIYSCSGIGSNGGKQVADVVYFSDDTNTLTNTQAVNSLLSRINYNNAELQAVSTSNTEAIELMNEIDLYSFCLSYAQKYSNDTNRLRQAGIAIGNILADGAFIFNSFDDSAREDHLLYLDDAIRSEFENNVPSRNAEFDQWWKENVMQLNKVYCTSGEAAMIDSAINQSISGIGAVYDGWENDKDLSSLLTKGSEFFIYLYFTDKQLAKLPKRFREKKRNQQNIYEHCKDKFVGIYGSEADLQRIIRSGLIQYFGEKPSVVCERIVASPRSYKGIGPFIADDIIIAIITAVATIIAAIMGVIAAAINKSAAQYEAITQQSIDEGCPDEDDFEGLDDQNKTKKNNMITIAALAAGAYFLLK